MCPHLLHIVAAVQLSDTTKDAYRTIRWKIKNNKIVEGRHFAGDQHNVDRFFHKISQSTGS